MELHTGTYCNATEKDEIDREIQRIYDAAFRAMKTGYGSSNNPCQSFFRSVIEDAHGF